jgi:hypothetical protein
MTIKDYLLASPYNDRTNFGGDLTENIFFHDYFIGRDDGTYAEINERLNKLLSSENVSSQFPPVIFLTGYMGTGKTTYIHYYVREKLRGYNSVFFSFGNISPERNRESIRIFEEHFTKLLCRIFQRFGMEFTIMLSNICGRHLDLITIFPDTFFNALSNIIEEMNQLNIDILLERRFLELLDATGYKDLHLLLLAFIFQFPEKYNELYDFGYKEDLPFLLIYDDIDHIRIEHFNREFPNFIDETYHKLRELLRNLAEAENPNQYASFLFCLRDANCPIMNRQLPVNVRCEVEFKPSNIGDRILLERLAIAKKEQFYLANQRTDFLEYVFKDPYTKDVFSPLFNFNIRKLGEFFDNLTIDYDVDQLYLPLILDLKNYPQGVVGSRGIEYHLVIKYLFTQNYLSTGLLFRDEAIGQQGGNVNPARMILTNLHNINMFALENRSKKVRADPAPLSDLYELYRQIFRSDEHKKKFFKIITELFAFHQRNWCHLLSFDGKHISSLQDFQDEIQNAIADDIDALAYITLKLTPAGFTYLNNIMRHYEFFSIIRAKHGRPLFANTKVDYRTGRIRLDALNEMKETFKAAKHCVEHLDGFLNHVEDDGIVKNFESTAHCFRIHSYEEAFRTRGRYPHSRLYSVRIIDTHIRYIDSYRCYILNNHNHIKNLDPKHKQVINKDIVEIIDNYVSILKKSSYLSRKPRVQDLISVFEANMAKIKGSGFSDFTTMVNDGRKEDADNMYPV